MINENLKNMTYNELIIYASNLEKENSIQWHDLRKDPNDLPKDNRDVINERGMIVWCEDGVWYENFGAMKIKTYPIAWCEIPIFKEQKLNG